MNVYITEGSGQMKRRDGKSKRRKEKKKEDQRRDSQKRREEKTKEDQRRDRQKKEDPGARKNRKAAKNCVFQLVCGSGGSKSKLAKSHFQAKMYKTHHSRTIVAS